jgi:hypothetical protein
VTAFQRGLATAGSLVQNIDRIAALAQASAQVFGEFGLIFDNQDFHGAPCPG